MKYIFDTDGGGDDLAAISLLLANVAESDVLGITTVFGNTNPEHAARNMCDMVSLLGHSDIPVYIGHSRPLSKVIPFDDNAYGEDGVGGTCIPRSQKQAEKESASDWLERTLENADEEITIFSLGPATNLAKLFIKRPDLLDKPFRIIAMSGAIMPLGANDQPIVNDGHIRRGNITKRAEFNLFQDPDALSTLIKPDIDLTIFPMDAAHQIKMDTDLEERLTTAADDFGQGLVSMLDNSKPLDQKNFLLEKEGYWYDPLVIAYTLRPDLFTERKEVFPLVYTHDDEETLETSEHGSLSIVLQNLVGKAHIVPSQKDPEGIKTFMTNSYSRFRNINFGSAKSEAPHLKSPEQPKHP